MKHFNRLFLVVLCCITTNIFASEALKTNLKNRVEEFQKTHFLNAIYMVSEDDHTLLKGAKGFYSMEEKTPLVADQNMPIASGTKQMTAAAIMRLQERGVLNVQDKISKHLPANSYYWDGKMPKWADELTIHQLLIHSTGLLEYIPALKLDITKPHKEINRDIIQFAIAHPQHFKAGEQFEYCNTNYVLLGLIIEAGYGKDFASVLQDEFFTPLGLKNTRVASMDEAMKFQTNRLPGYPARYFVVPTEAQPQVVPAQSDILLAPFADGGVLSSLEDMNKWIHALHDGKIVSKESYDAMMHPYIQATKEVTTDTYSGYGMFIYEMPNGEKVYSHGGGAVATRGEYSYIPSKKIALAMITNAVLVPTLKYDPSFDLMNIKNQIDVIFFKRALMEEILGH